MQYSLKFKRFENSNKTPKKTDGRNSLKFGRVEDLSFHNFCNKLN